MLFAQIALIFWRTNMSFIEKWTCLLHLIGKSLLKKVLHECHFTYKYYIFARVNMPMRLNLSLKNN